MDEKPASNKINISKKPKWALCEADATPESVYLNRRQWLKGTAGVGALAGLGALGVWGMGEAKAQRQPDELTALNAPRNEVYRLDRGITPEEINARFNNFYEFGSHKAIFGNTRKFQPRPWELVIDGMVDQEIRIDIDDLITKFDLEERLYRHRCVEAWSMTIPWTGFQLSELIKMANPTSGAKYVRFETFSDPSQAPAIRTQPWQPWPYVEGLTIDEAMHELAFMVVGDYGKVLKRQHGAPLRLAVPWKYGFKHIKSIQKITFTDQRPKSFWETLLGQEYGFWANVNPEVPHPRWSQATEEVLHTRERVPTLLFNGYAEQVAGLYANLNLPDTVLYR